MGSQSAMVARGFLGSLHGVSPGEGRKVVGISVMGVQGDLHGGSKQGSVVATPRIIGFPLANRRYSSSFLQARVKGTVISALLIGVARWVVAKSLKNLKMPGMRRGEALRKRKKEGMQGWSNAQDDPPMVFSLMFGGYPTATKVP